MHELIYLGNDLQVVTKPPKSVAMPTQTRGGLVLTWSVSNFVWSHELHELVINAIMTCLHLCCISHETVLSFLS